jgi:hypothetical protein
MEARGETLLEQAGQCGDPVSVPLSLTREAWRAKPGARRNRPPRRSEHGVSASAAALLWRAVDDAGPEDYM